MRPAPHLDPQELAATFAGGVLGTLARAALSQSLAVRAGEWPWATFAVNILAALALGWLVTRLRRLPAPTPRRRAFLLTGICGALGTFSTMMLELLRMIDGAHWALALGYALASVLGGLGALLLSTRLARHAAAASA